MDLTGRSRRSSTLLFKKFKKRLENNTIKENWKKEIITQPRKPGVGDPPAIVSSAGAEYAV